MEYRQLGNTEINMSVISLGIINDERIPSQDLNELVAFSYEQGINYIEISTASPLLREKLGKAIRPFRREIFITGHLGLVLNDHKYGISRDPEMCERYFNDLLHRLDIDYVDVLMLYQIDTGEEDFESVLGHSEYIELAERLQRQGKTRYIGMSSHTTEPSRYAIKSGIINVLMYPINKAFDLLPGNCPISACFERASYQELDLHVTNTERQALYQLCEGKGIGLLSMKTFGAGYLLNDENVFERTFSPGECIAYSLSKPGVCSAVIGCRHKVEMEKALKYIDNPDASV
jgi:predicted aldo/keto reductase-like oxidoreductase